MKVRVGKLRVAWVAALISGATLIGAATQPRAVPATRVAQPIAGARVSAQPGDLRLDNAEVTAVIRKADGALVDFLRKGAVLPSSDALGATTGIDGLWDVVPVALVDGRALPRPESVRVTATASGVRLEGTWRGEGLSLGVSVDYTLDRQRPKLALLSHFTSREPLPPGFEAGFELRWGNTGHYVDGKPLPLTNFEGPARWVGRRGAGGDLMLRALAPAVFAARFGAKDRGFAPAVRALEPLPRPSSREVRASFELSYEPLPLPPAAAEAPGGTLVLTVRDERGRPLPSKLSLWKDGRADALFPDFGGLDGADRFVWTGNGLIERVLPEGSYELLVSAGPEREIARTRLKIAAKGRERREIVLRRVLATPGWTSADLHLHQAPSVDADLSLESRLIAIAAEGVEFAVASDHFVVTDFAPALASVLRSGALSRPLVTVAGSEVSTVGNRFGHFNVFPLALDQNVEYENTTPARLFASARRASPGGVLQVNHPRHDPRLGYFIAYEFDRTTGQARPGFDPSFDAVEVFNGFHVQDQAFTEGLLRDFLRLLGNGRRYVATGSSDSHQLAFLDPGLPRTLIAYGGADDDADATAPVARVLAALKAGRAVVTSGPMIEATVSGAGPGETAHHVGKRAQLRIRVRAAPWISTRTLSVLEGPAGNVLHRLTMPRAGGVVRFDRTLPIDVSGPTFVVVSVLGDEPLPNTSRPDVVPFAFTNPIWLTP